MPPRRMNVTWCEGMRNLFSMVFLDTMSGLSVRYGKGDRRRQYTPLPFFKHENKRTLRRGSVYDSYFTLYAQQCQRVRLNLACLTLV